MTDPDARLIRHNAKWHVIARKGAEGAAEAAWVSIGGCTCHLTAVRVWLACLTTDKRRGGQ